MAGAVTGAVRAAWIEPAYRRVGILGGTFDPIHYAHLAVAEQVCEALGLDRVLFVPAGEPPHKPGAAVAAAAARAAMVELAIAGNPAFAMCRIELDRPGPSYSVDSLGLLAAEAVSQGVERELFFILSDEALVGLPEWHDPRRIPDLCQLAVVPRLGRTAPDRDWLEVNFPGRSDRFVFVDTVPLANSSSEVRRRAAMGESIRYLVPPAVDAYVRDHRLYRSDPEDRQK
jgi:nicotinate-nucleotide adenylyltransferase